MTTTRYFFNLSAFAMLMILSTTTFAASPIDGEAVPASLFENSNAGEGTHDEQTNATLDTDFVSNLTGTWDGPLEMGTILNFIYEFKVVENKWVGRWMNTDKNIWVNIKGLAVKRDSISFYFETKPENMTVELEFDENNSNVIVGAATYKSMGLSVPLKLVKILEKVE